MNVQASTALAFCIPVHKVKSPEGELEKNECVKSFKRRLCSGVLQLGKLTSLSLNALFKSFDVDEVMDALASVSDSLVMKMDQAMRGNFVD